MDAHRITSDDLLAHLLGDAGAPSRAELERALQADADLRRQFEALSGVTGCIGRAADLEGYFSVDAGRLSALAASTRPGIGWVRVAGRQVREVIASLRPTTGPAPALRAQAGATRAVFEGDGVEVSVQMSAVAGPVTGSGFPAVRVMGRLSGAGSAAAVTLSDGQGSEVSAETDEDGFFELSVPASSYRCEVILDDRVVVIPSLDVRL